MKKYNVNEGKDELFRALLLMKYDTKKTLSENVKSNNLINEESNSCPNSIDEATIKVKASRASDIFRYMTTEFQRMGYIRERAIEIYNIIDELSKKNFYDSLTKTCENSLKRFKDEFESEYTSGGFFTITDNLEEEFNDLINGYIGEQDKVAKKYLEQALKKLNENINKPVKQNDEDTINCPQGQFYNPATKKCQTTNCGGCVPSPCPTGTKLVNGKCVGGGGSWKDCKGTYTRGCKSDVIAKVQKCLGLTSDGKFGPKTDAALKSKGFTNGFTDEDVTKICNRNDENTTTTTTYPFDPTYAETNDIK